MKKLIYTFIILVFSINLLQSQDDDKIKMRGINNLGTEFYLSFHPNNVEKLSDQTIVLYMYSEYETEVRVNIPADDFSETINLEPFKKQELEIPALLAQLEIRKEFDEPQRIEILEQKGIHVTSDEPIMCFALSYSKNSSDGFMVLPKHVLGNKYVVANALNVEDNSEANVYINGYVSIIANYDETEVDFTLGGNGQTYMKSQNQGELKPGDTYTAELNKGDVLYLPARGTLGDLSGSVVESNYPVSVISGNFCASLPENNLSCDYTISQALPDISWDDKYYILPIPDRTIAGFIKVFSFNPSTSVYRNGELFGTISQVGIEEENGFINRRFLFENDSPEPIILTAENNIAVSYFNTSSEEDGAFSDVFQMNLIPESQFSDEIAFPVFSNSNQLFPLANNYVSIIYKATAAGTIPNDFMYAEVDGGEVNWQRVNTWADNPGVKIEEENVERHYYHLILKIPNLTKSYKFKANDPFAAYLIGNDFFTSYGSSAFMNLKDNVTNDDKLLNYYGDTSGPSIKGKFFDDLPPSSGISIIQLIKDESQNFELTYEDIVFSQSKSIDIELNAIDLNSPAVANIYVSDRSGNGKTFEFTYVPPQYEIGFLEDEFTIYNVNDDVVSKTLYIKNIGEQDFVIEGFVLDQLNESFRIIDTPEDYPVTLSQNEQITFEIELDPSVSTGEVTAILNPLIFGVEFEGTILNAVITEPGSITVTDANFGQVAINTEKETTIFIDNSSNSDVTVSNLSGIDGTPFSVDNVSLPIIIESGQKEELVIIFAPTTVGSFTSDLEFESNAEQDVSAKLIGEAVEGGNIVTDATLDFGSIVINSNLVKTLELSNNGDIDVELTSVDFYDGNGFEVKTTNFPKNIPVGGTVNIDIEFAPTVLKTYTDTLYYNVASAIQPSSIGKTVLEGASHPVSVNENEKSNALLINSVYQETNTLQIELQSDYAGNYDLTISDILGRIVYKSEVLLQTGSNKLSLNPNLNANETLFLTIENNERKATNKFILAK